MFIITLSDIIFLVILGLFLIWWCGMMISSCIKQHRCKHEKFRENMSFQAICTSCGKDLGFIGTWREKVRAKSEKQG